MSNELESTISEILTEAQVDDAEFNSTYIDIVYMMRKVIEDSSYRKQLYDVGKEDERLGDSISDQLKKEDLLRQKQFGLESMLKQVLWNGQVPEEKFDIAFNEIIANMKKLAEDGNYVKDLYLINLDDYSREN